MSDEVEEMPDNPFTENEAAWISMHAMFQGMIGAGFTEDQAASILGAFLSHQVSNDDDES